MPGKVCPRDSDGEPILPPSRGLAAALPWRRTDRRAKHAKPLQRDDRTEQHWVVLDRTGDAAKDPTQRFELPVPAADPEKRTSARESWSVKVDVRFFDDSAFQDRWPVDVSAG